MLIWFFSLANKKDKVKKTRQFLLRPIDVFISNTVQESSGETDSWVVNKWTVALEHCWIFKLRIDSFVSYK